MVKGAWDLCSNWLKKKKKDFHTLKIEAKYGCVLEVTADASHNYDTENKLSLRLFLSFLTPGKPKY